MPMLNNFSANMTGFNSPSSYPSNVGTAPSTIGGGAPQSPFAQNRDISALLGNYGVDNSYGSGPTQPQQGMPPPPPMQHPNVSTMTNTPPPMGQQATPQAPQQAMAPSPGVTPATNNMLSAEQQALMRELSSGAIGMMPSA